MNEATIIKETKGRINYILSTFNLKLKENEASRKGRPLWRKQKLQGTKFLPIEPA